MSEPIRCRSFFLNEQSTVEGDVLKDVVLLGPESSNGNSYTHEALKSAVPFLQNRAVYVDHDLKAKARKLGERFGHAENVRYVEQDHDGRPRVRGDIPFLRSHPMAARVVEAVGKGLGYFGCSFVANGVGRKEGERRIVESITGVASLDLVDRAATGTLVEQDDGGDEPPAPMDPAAHAQEGMVKMVTAIVIGDGTPQEKAKKIQALLEAAEGTTGGEPPPPEMPPAPAEGGEEPMAEQHRRAWAKWTQTMIEQSQQKAQKATEASLAALTQQLTQLSQSLPQLVEQAARPRDGKYVKPATAADAPAGGRQAPAAPNLANKDERKKYLYTP